MRILASTLLATSLLAPDTVAHPDALVREDGQAGATDWVTGSPSDVLRRVRDEGRLAAVYFWSGGSQFCEKLYLETLTTPQGVEALSTFTAVSIQVGTAEGPARVQRFNVTTLPTLLFLGDDGSLEDALVGFVPVGAFVNELQRIQAGRQTLSTMRKQAAAAPQDLALRYQLSQKLAHVGRQKESTDLVESIERDDPDARTVIGAQLRMWAVMAEIASAAATPEDFQQFDLEKMATHLADVHPTAVRFEGWEWVAQIEFARGNRAEARDAYRRAVTYLPDTRALSFGIEMLEGMWEGRDRLEEEDKQLAFDMTDACRKSVERQLDEARADRGSASVPDLENALADQLGAVARTQFLLGRHREAAASLARARGLRPELGQGSDWAEWIVAQAD